MSAVTVRTMGGYYCNKDELNFDLKFDKTPLFNIRESRVG